MTQQKVALVTGGNRGIGKEIVKKLIEKDNAVIFTYRSNAKEAEDLIAEFESKGTRIKALRLDVSKMEEFESFSESINLILNEWQVTGIDSLVNNAGIGFFVPFEEATVAQFDEMLNVHFKGPFFLTQKLLSSINDSASIVNISSTATRVALPGFSVYAAMKSAMETISLYQSKELGAKKIRSNSILPGPVATDFSGGAVRDIEDINSRIAQQHALGRVGLPKDIASAVAFLCSEDSAWIDGQAIEVSGGYM